MMGKIWQKHTGAGLHPAVNEYMISKDLEADNAMLPFDVKASIAHAKMLSKIKLLTSDESNSLVSELEKILTLHKKGEFILKQENEDVHTEIENFLIQNLGDVGKKIHVGRSRNDQVLVALRLLNLNEIKQIKEEILNLSNTVLSFAKKYEFLPMPGYTHLQHAMPSSIGMWAGAIVESLLDDHEILNSTYKVLNKNPLGSAAGFGTALPLDREETTTLLGFAETQVNSLYCQNSRAKFDTLTVSSLIQVMMTLGRVASDLLLYTSKEFSFFAVDPSLTTGSSIMPQKRNLDIMEVLRANVAIVQAKAYQIQTAAQNLTSGYQKDVKTNKKAVLDAFSITKESLKIVDFLFQGLTPDEVNLLKPFSNPEIFAADVANELVGKGMTFRDAYKKVGEELKELSVQDPFVNIRSKTHLGAPGNLGLGRYEDMIKKLKK